MHFQLPASPPAWTLPTAAPSSPPLNHPPKHPPPDPPLSWTVAQKRAGDFGTKTSCTSSKVNDAMVKAFNAAQKAALAGDVPALQKAQADVKKQFQIVFTQAIRTYANEMYFDQQAKLPQLEHQTEAYVFFRTIAPLIAAANANTSAALDYWFFPGQPADPNIDVNAGVALAAAYKGMGITAEEIGKYGAQQPELKCAVIDSNAGGIVSTTTARPDGAREAPAAAPAAGRRLRFFWF
jgi:hypothetical protein